MIKAVFLDMYGTLAGFEPSRFEVQSQACAEFGIELTPEGVPKGYAAADEYMSAQNRFAPEPVLRRRLTYATRKLDSGKIGWQYDLVIREQVRKGTGPQPPDMWPMLPSVKCPTLIVRGMETDLLTPEVTRRMLDTLPDGHLAEVPRAAHVVFEDNPEGFLEAVRGWL